MAAALAARDTHGKASCLGGLCAAGLIPQDDRQAVCRRMASARWAARRLWSVDGHRVESLTDHDLPGLIICRDLGDSSGIQRRETCFKR